MHTEKPTNDDSQTRRILCEIPYISSATSPGFGSVEAWCLFLLLCSGNTRIFSLPWMQMVVPGGAVSRMWRAAKGHHVELQGSPAAVWNHAPGLYKCLIFQSLAAPRADKSSAFSLPCSTAAFLPCYFFPSPCIWDLHSDPILSFVLHISCGEACIALQ